jgi:hypothetical protein
MVVLALLAGCDRLFLDPRESTDGPTPDLCAGGIHAGNGGVLGVCLDAAPADMLASDAEINTGRQTEHECTQLVAQPDTSEVCVVAARRIEISAVVRAVGSRPLVVFALDEIVLTGALDVSSRQIAPPAGSGFSGCSTSGTNGTASGGGGGGGGGAGGTFAAAGGAGGTGANGTAPKAGGAPANTSSLDVVRGGCRGGFGGAGDGGQIGGPGGDSGGAVYLIAGRTIRIEGTINASGAGGRPEQNMALGSGGGGGGSGGLIGLDAPSIVIGSTAVLVANGGGGAGGGSVGQGGIGGQPDLTGAFPFVASGGAGGSTSGGMGGTGGAAQSPMGNAGSSAANGGGGGGGGVGYVVLYAAGAPEIQPGARISPAPGP